MPKPKKVYCGSCKKLPSAVYSRFGTPAECLAIGIGVGRKIEFEHMQARLNKKGIKVRRSKAKSCGKKLRKARS
jgi:hypothetical protein